MSRRKGEPLLIVGGSPRVDLLPPEVGQSQRNRAIRRAMVGLVLFVALVVGVGYGLASFAAETSDQQLALETARTSDLIAQQAEYVEVRATIDSLATAVAARMVGASTEINLAAYLAEIESRLPVGGSIRMVAVETASPFDGYTQATAPLQPQRIATLNFTVETAEVTDVRDWLLRLQTLEGFTDATPGTVTKQAEGDGYTSEVTLHVDELAYSGRFSAPPLDDAEPTEEAPDESTAQGDN